MFVRHIHKRVFSFAHPGDGENSWITDKCQGPLLPLPPLDRTDVLHWPYITPALYYTSPILYRPYIALVHITPAHITPALYYTGPYYTCLIHPTFNLTTNHVQNYRYFFRPCLHDNCDNLLNKSRHFDCKFNYLGVCLVLATSYHMIINNQPS